MSRRNKPRCDFKIPVLTGLYYQQGYDDRMSNRPRASNATVDYADGYRDADSFLLYGSRLTHYDDALIDF